MILHTVTASGPALEDCLRVASSGDTLLLMGDAVYAVLKGSAASEALLACEATVLVLQADAAAAGVLPRSCFETIDMAGFVTLTETYPRQQAWY